MGVFPDRQYCASGFPNRGWIFNANLFPASRNVGRAVVPAAGRSVSLGGEPESEADNDDHSHNKPGQQAVAHFFALSPSSTRRRMASERDAASCLSDQACMSSINGAGSRMPTNGSRPVAGLPLFGFTAIDFFMIWVLQ
jgi:hypothetical protein